MRLKGGHLPVETVWSRLTCWRTVAGMWRRLCESSRCTLRFMGTVYVYKLGGTGIYKVGKTKDLTRRRGTYETISTEPLIPIAQIETTNEDEVETFIKHRLQSRRWLGGAGRELYEVDQAELDSTIAAAEKWNDVVLPKVFEAERLSRKQSDGRVLTPGDVERELHRELMRLRQIELTAAQERQRIETELKNPYADRFSSRRNCHVEERNEDDLRYGSSEARATRTARRVPH
jgi:hypothetical protein